jgi:hypothetical protein
MPAPQRRVVDRDVAGARRRSSGGPTASPRTRAEASAVGVWLAGSLWFLDASESLAACRAAEIEAELAWSALSQHSGDAPEIMAALEQLMRALVVLQDAACRFAGGGRQGG